MVGSWGLGLLDLFFGDLSMVGFGFGPRVSSYLEVQGASSLPSNCAYNVSRLSWVSIPREQKWATWTYIPKVNSKVLLPHTLDPKP